MYIARCMGAESVVMRIKGAVNLGARHCNDYAVLYRTNAQSRAMEEMCIRYGVPYRIVSGRFYTAKIVSSPTCGALPEVTDWFCTYRQCTDSRARRHQCRKIPRLADPDQL